jgi:hypothetical protein
LVEVKVGVQHVTRELIVETNMSAADVEKAFRSAFSVDPGIFSLTDERGRKILVPADRLAYVDIGEEVARRVGFGAV